MSEIDLLKTKLSTAASILRWELSNMWGHVTVRTPDRERFLLMHLRPPEDPSLPPDEVLEYDLNGKLISGRREQPDEIFFYACPYKARSDVNAVIHCHPDMAIALTAVNRKIIPLHLSSRIFSPEVPVSPWLYGFWREDGEEATKQMGSNGALMIRAHGSLVTATSIEAACIATVNLERTAKLLLLANQIGDPTPLSSEAMAKFKTVEDSRAKDKTRISQSLVPLEWRYYEFLLKNGQLWSRL